MEVKQLLEEAEAKQEEAVRQVNLLNQQSQEFLQEALRLEGEIRVLKQLLEKGAEK